MKYLGVKKQVVSNQLTIFREKLYIIYFREREAEREGEKECTNGTI